MPVVDKVLFRADASAAFGGYFLQVNDGFGQSDAKGLTLGPRVALNLGYAPSHLIRIGLGVGADFAMNLWGEQNIPNTTVDGWMRWFAGPTVGFRFAPKTPLEIEAHLAFAHLRPVGSQATVTVPGYDPAAYELGSNQFGMANGVTFFYRPSGPRVPFALFAGLHFGWAVGANSDKNALTVTEALQLGVSGGL
jgi:hypothetical protein